MRLRRSRFRCLGRLIEGGRAGVDRTKPPIPAGISQKRPFQRLFVELGPESVGHVKLAIGDLPQEKVADAKLAGGPDQQVGIGQLRRVQVLADARFVDVLQPTAAPPCGPGQSPGQHRRSPPGRCS